MRRVVTVSAAVLILAGLTAGPAAADTIGGPADTWLASGFLTVVDHGTSWSGYIQVEESRLTGARYPSVYLEATGAERTCDADTPDDPSDDYTGTDTLSWNPGSASIVDVHFKPDATAAKFALRASADVVTYDACTGEPVATRREQHRFEVALKASDPGSTETNPVVVDNGDGTASPGTETFTYQPAAGKVAVDGHSAIIAEASIQHVLVVRD